MRNLTESERRLCSWQARLFEASLENSEDGSAVFVRRFMLSDLARRVDESGMALDVSPASQLVSDVDAQFGGKPYGTEKYSANELYWMGYLYRCMCLATGMSSRAAYRTIGARDLRLLHYPYHSLDTVQAVERILEARGLRADRKSIEYGVVKLREIKARRAQSAKTR